MGDRIRVGTRRELEATWYAGRGRMKLMTRGVGTWPTRSLGWALGLLLLAPQPSHAALSEPDAIFYGAVLVDGIQVTSGFEISAHPEDPNGEILAVDTLGSTIAAPGIYILRVRLEHPTSDGEGRTEGIGRVGDMIEIRVAGQAVPILIMERGTSMRVDFALGGSGDLSAIDTDEDGVNDASDNCSRVPNNSQSDENQNGIGDDCEGVVHPGPEFRGVEHTANLASTRTGSSGTAYGAVSYPFVLQSTEVTNAQYVDFLNAVAAGDPHELFNVQMQASPRGGIARRGDPNSHSYQVRPNMGNKPVNFVSWLDAARYVNWLQNARGSGDTETGAFDLSIADPGVAAALDETASWSLPTEDEWVKAAYYDPSLGLAEDGENYWRYPTREDVEPIRAASDLLGDVSNPGPSVANYDSAVQWNGQLGNLTTVASAGATSFFGTQDQGGNVAEWLAELGQAAMRVTRGGGYNSPPSTLEQAGRELLTPDTESASVGFRILHLPPPCGDTNGDGVVDILDWVIYERQLADLEPGFADPRTCSVVDGSLDGPLDCDRADADLVRQALAGLAEIEQRCAAFVSAVLP